MNVNFIKYKSWLQQYGLAIIALAASLFSFSANLWAAPPLVGPLVGNRSFSYTYEADTLPADTLQYRQWVTWKSDKNIDSVYDRVEFRHELAYGISDDWQFSLYLSDWYYERGPSLEKDGSDWSDAALESIYTLTDATADPIGSALAGQAKIGDDFFALEGKVILQVNMGEAKLAYNAALEAQWWNLDDRTDRGTLEQTLGLNYQVVPMLALGVELLSDIVYEDWSERQDATFYVGPVVALRDSGWWVTITPLFQTTGVDSEVNYNFRLIAGIDL